MASKKALLKLFSRVEAQYEECWQTLACFHEPEYARDHGERIFDFQPALAECLLQLSRENASIKKECRGLVARKARLDLSWFERRMATLHGYQEAIRAVEAVGRRLGDSFAWFFYCRNVELLKQHVGHPPNGPAPPGDGGLGELGVVQNLPKLGRFLLLFHGTTTYLRVGDFTVVDIESMTAVGLGEIKTLAVDGQEAQVQLHIFHRQAAGLQTDLEATFSAAGEPECTSELSPSMRDRLARQMDAMSSAMRTADGVGTDASTHGTESPDGVRLSSQQAGDYRRLLIEVVQSAPPGGFAWRRTGQAMMVGAYRSRHRSLARRVLPNRPPEPFQVPEEFQAEAASLLVDGSHYNKLLLGSVPALDPNDTDVLLNAPIFWWLMDPEVTRKLIFGEAFGVTVFNHARLVQAMIRAGFEIEEDPGGTRGFVMEKEGRHIRLGDHQVLIPMIKDGLTGEDRVAQLFAETALALLRDVPKGAGMVQVNMSFQHTPYPVLERLMEEGIRRERVERP